eukprot:scaffold15347_cov73-Skeletonema_dohrnii-CCMP3373.AAC.1
MPSLVPSESSQPSSMPSLVPSESLQPSSMPSVTPSVSAQPSFTRATKIMNLLLTVSSEDALDDENSPQGKAKLWVTNSPLQPGEDDAQIIQQYILAVFYYATGGAADWTDKEGWLGSETECEWDHVVCSGDVITQLRLFDNNLVGSIPTELGKLDNLVYLRLDRNDLTGGIPTELGDLDSLQGLFLNNNQLTGGIPTELGQLDNLEELWLDGNQLTGGIDAGICNLQQFYLYSLVADCTRWVVQGKAVISVSCVQVQEHEGLWRKRKSFNGRQGRGVD